AVKETLKAWIKKGRIDFGVLSESFQIEVLRKLKENPDLLDNLSIPPLMLSPEREIAERREIIRRVHSLPRYGEILAEVYDCVGSGAVGKVSHLPTQNVLRQFLHPSRLNLLHN